MRDKVKCPVCKRDDERVQIVYVPLGHGRYSQYVCLECGIRFSWGSNKFGDITDVKQIEKVCWIENVFSDNYCPEEDMIKPEEHPGYRIEEK